MILFNYYDYAFYQLRSKQQLDLARLRSLAHPEKGFDRKKMLGFQILPRDLSDIFNVFSVNTVARSFTDVEDLIKDYLSDNNFFVKKAQLLGLEKHAPDWKKAFTVSFADALEILEKKVQTHEKKRQYKMRTGKSLFMGSPQSNLSRRKSSKNFSGALALILAKK
mmetsp:Transcript_28527/g.43104  ORF Transcript_28527/g.43104 Transcript_28527/m.43104 type:complete len:165 (-) Transcript_28527:18-512(-)